MSCNLCGKDDAAPVAVQNGFRVVRCRACGLVYVDPRPRDEDLPPLYASYHAREGGDAASWDRLMAGIFREAAEILCSGRNGSPPGRLLDVGCGHGGFVSTMLRRGWAAEGIDPSPAAVASAIARGLPVRLGTIEDEPFAGEPYDAVTLFYVLEHLGDPLAALGKAHSLLAGGGTLVVRVPDTTPVVRILSTVGLGKGLYDPPFHLFDMSPRVLRKMLEASGFADTRLFPGANTRPPRLGSRLVTAFFGRAASMLHRASGGSLLLPGVSKTAVARKPA